MRNSWVQVRVGAKVNFCYCVLVVLLSRHWPVNESAFEFIFQVERAYFCDHCSSLSLFLSWFSAPIFSATRKKKSPKKKKKKERKKQGKLKGCLLTALDKSSSNRCSTNHSFYLNTWYFSLVIISERHLDWFESSLLFVTELIWSSSIFARIISTECWVFRHWFLSILSLN